MSVFKKKGIVVGVLLAFTGELVLLALLLGVCAWFVQREWLGLEYMNVYIILCVFLSVFTVCTTTSGARGRGYLPFCLLSSGSLVIFLLLAAASVNGLESYGAWTLRVFASAFSAALAAALVQIRHNAARKMRHRRG